MAFGSVRTLLLFPCVRNFYIINTILLKRTNKMGKIPLYNFAAAYFYCRKKRRCGQNRQKMNCQTKSNSQRDPVHINLWCKLLSQLYFTTDLYELLFSLTVTLDRIIHPRYRTDVSAQKSCDLPITFSFDVVFSSKSALFYGKMAVVHTDLLCSKLLSQLYFTTDLYELLFFSICCT